jgi:VanZ family protein
MTRPQTPPQPGEHMTTLKRWTWLFLAGGLFLAMLLQAVVPIPREKLYIEAILDAGHVPLFTLFTVLLLSLLLEVGRVRRAPRAVVYAFVLAVAAGMGLVTELLQSRVARDADATDFGRDLFGALAAVFLVMSWRARIQLRAPAVIWSLAVAGLLSGIAGVWAPASVLMDYRARDAAFPILADFEQDWEGTFLVERGTSTRIVAPPTGWDRDHGRVLATLFEEGDLPAISLLEPQSNWSGFTEMEFDVFLPDSTPLDLFVRIDDNSHNGAYSDRYNGTFALLPGQNHVVVPLEEVKQAPRTRAMNLHAVRSISFFGGKEFRGVTLYFDNLQLTKN